jgi:hypothetical protein
MQRSTVLSLPPQLVFPVSTDCAPTAGHKVLYCCLKGSATLNMKGLLVTFSIKTLPLC